MQAVTLQPLIINSVTPPNELQAVTLPAGLKPTFVEYGVTDFPQCSVVRCSGVLWHGAACFRPKFTPGNAFGAHACSLQARSRVTFLSGVHSPVHSVNSVQTLQVNGLDIALGPFGPLPVQ
jgi:hypothetical protein